MLSLLHSEKIRQNAPAVLAVQAERAQKRGKLSQTQRLLRMVGEHLREVSLLASFISGLREAPTRKLVLPLDGHKYQEVAGELISAGLAPDCICELQRRFRVWTVRRRVICLALGFKLFALRMYLARRLSPRAFVYLDVLFAYLALTAALRPVQTNYWVIIGDLSPFLISLSAALGRNRQAWISWQFDFLDFKPFPLAPRIAVVLNEDGIQLSRKACAGVREDAVFWRPVPEVQPIRNDWEQRPIGVLLNAFADHAVLRRLEELQRRLAKPFLIRLHSNSKLWEASLRPGCSIADRNQSLEAFVDQTGLILCGNTSAQLKALFRGAPVVQLAGLDAIRFDHHGYVRRGIVIGCTDDTALNSDEIRSFYQTTRFAGSLRCLVGPENTARTNNLARLAAHLTAHFEREEGGR